MSRRVLALPCHPLSDTGHFIQHVARTMLAGCIREPNYSAVLADSKRDRGTRMGFTQCIQSCQVLGARLHLPFLHFLQLSAAAASQPLTQTGSSSGERGILVPCFQSTSKQNETKRKHTLSSSCSSSSQRHAPAPPLSLW